MNSVVDFHLGSKVGSYLGGPLETNSQYRACGFTQTVHDVTALEWWCYLSPLQRNTLCGDNTTILLQRNRHLLSRVDTHLLGLALLQAEYSSIYAPLAHASMLGCVILIL